MKITKAELIELSACEEGLERFIAQTNNTDEPVEVTSLVGGKNTYGDLLWLAAKKLPKDRIVRFACDCALLNIELIKPYADEYDDVVEFLRNPTNGTAADAAAAAYAAARAAADADAAAAAYAAARAAAYASDATAAYAAARAGSRDKIDELLKELFA